MGRWSMALNWITNLSVWVLSLNHIIIPILLATMESSIKPSSKPDLSTEALACVSLAVIKLPGLSSFNCRAKLSLSEYLRNPS